MRKVYLLLLEFSLQSVELFAQLLHALLGAFDASFGVPDISLRLF